MPIEQMTPEHWRNIAIGTLLFLAALWYFARKGAQQSQTVGLPPTTPLNLDGEIKRLIAENKKIHAIKLVVDQRGLTLQEAKAYVEAIEREANPPPQTFEDMDARIRNLLRQNNKLLAVKLYREQTGAGLKEAKDYVDAIEQQGLL